MEGVLIALGLYCMYYTFVFARMVWKDGNRFGGMAVALLSLCFPALYLVTKLL
ncbi:hypothetical protein [Ectobacillus ponti]|uniref:Uncharacterized protein n=1 Tax=Ectobacillus ponti TaxID=2961894 RepID=A0AA42BPX5_9BACI|nr:hypothetical protein [Ectobacillus ponti]MCP8969252.1 hypothetical protein [Ectobacillus ponti]